MSENTPRDLEVITIETVVLQSLLNWSFEAFERNGAAIEKINLQDLVRISGITMPNPILSEVINDLRQRELVGPKVCTDNDATKSLEYSLDKVQVQLDQNLRDLDQF